MYWEIGNTAVPDPDEFSNLYAGQINVTSTQTLKGRLIDAAGNPGAVGSFDYRIGTPPAAPSNLTASEVAPAGSARLTWNSAQGATGYNVYRNDVKVNATPITATVVHRHRGRSGRRTATSSAPSRPTASSRSTPTGSTVSDRGDRPCRPGCVRPKATAGSP